MDFFNGVYPIIYSTTLRYSNFYSVFEHPVATVRIES